MNLSSIQGMPPAAKAGIAIATGGGILAALAFMFPTRVLMIIALGLVLVALLFVAFKVLMKWLEKRKAAPMERAIAGHSSSAPTSINNPARRARLDDMRKSFETGVVKFRDAGKNIYSLPWYILVGEPGSGKTEAIRHCNVGFPPGLQDQLQGVGGTVNMNWWFTNHAVILDTAGRLMFEEVEPGTTSEWQEFLKLLRKVRPNCPVNGMLLVIPAESLIRDTADAIERKAGKIAQQLDSIQRTLGVRFPVYVVITKCDLINGFREFFDDLTDPQLQHQILGWSNPANLDDPFNPEHIEQHLKTVQQRLVRRRMALLQDPVHSEDPAKSRTEQVDALYAFPDSLVKIAPRLRRYLEMIFVAGEWSSKPLFLRGMYFTSSMREGSALDADLAEALGMPVEALPEGRVWERERAYFLRDLFMNKVFRERGLVTRASNTGAQMRKRRTMLYGVAAVGAIAVALLTFLGWKSLSGAVSEPSEFWTKAKDVYLDKGAATNWVSGDNPYLFPIAHPRAKDQAVFDYDGVAASATREIEAIPVADRKHATIGDFPTELVAQSKRTIGIPWIFKPVALVTGFKVENLADRERAAAAAALYERSILEPLVDYARARLRKETGEDAETTAWTSHSTAALRELISIEAGAVKPEASSLPATLVGDLSGYVLRQAEYEGPDAAARAEKDAAFKTDYDAYKAAQAEAARQVPQLQSAADWLYAPEQGRQQWPPAQMRTGDVQLLTRAFDRFRAQAGSDTAEAAPYTQVRRLMAALTELSSAEKDLLEVHIQTAPAQAWDERYSRVREAAAKVEGLLSVVEKRPLKQAFNEEFANFQKIAERAHNSLLERFAPVIDAEGNADERLAKDHKERVEALQGLFDKIKRSKTELTTRGPAIDADAKECERLDMLYLKAAGRTDHAFRQRLAMYDAANSVRTLGDAEGTFEVGGLKPRIDGVDRAVGDAKGKIEQFQRAATSGVAEAKPADDMARQAGEVSTKYAADVAGGQRRAALLTRWMDGLMGDAKGLETKAAALATAQKWEQRRPLVPLTRAASDRKGDFDPGFDPRAASAVLGDCAQAALTAAPGAGQPPLPKELADRADSLARAAKAYSDRYVEYWTKDFLADLAVVEQSWADHAAATKGLTSDSFNTPLAELSDIVAGAFRDVSGLMKNDAGDPSAIRRQAEGAKSSLQNNQSIRSGRVFAAWRGLGDDSITAANTIRLALKDPASFQEQYITCNPARAANEALGNFVERFWEDFCFASLKALTDRAKADGNAAYGRVRASAGRFPIVLGAGEAELSLRDLADLKADVDQAAAIGGRTGDAPAPRVIITCDRFNGLIGQLMGAGALDRNEQAWLSLVREIVDGLPDSRPLRAKVFTTTEKQLTPTEKPLDSIFIDMAIVAGADAPAAGARLRNSNTLIGEYSLPDPAPLSFFFFAAGAGGNKVDPGATFRIEGQWALLRLLDRYGAERSATDKRVWFVKLPVAFQNDRYFTWLRIELEKDLPDLKRWQELKPSP